MSREDPYEDIPKRVRIGAIHYDVCLMSRERADYLDAHARFSQTEHRIEIEPGLPPDHLLTCFLHEVCHGIAAAFGEPETPDERLIHMWGHGLVMFLADNPEAAGWLAKTWRTAYGGSVPPDEPTASPQENRRRASRASRTSRPAS